MYELVMRTGSLFYALLKTDYADIPMHRYAYLPGKDVGLEGKKSTKYYDVIERIARTA